MAGEANTDEADELYLVVIERFPASPIAEQARLARTRLAERTMRTQAGGDIRHDVVMYIAGALETFDKVGPARSQEITVEIAMKGQSGLDINDPKAQYTLKSLPGTFSGMQLVSMMYAGLRQIDPQMDAGIDLRSEYDAAMKLRAAR